MDGLYDKRRLMRFVNGVCFGGSLKKRTELLCCIKKGEFTDRETFTG